MNSLKSYILNEDHIGDLQGVRFIRHYTTLEGLLHILNDEKIKVNESDGDTDWFGYDIGPAKVVSFHDARTDPEIEEICVCNDDEKTLWSTETLGIHAEEICAFIEYNFDIMPWNIKQHATHIKILEHYIEEFVNIWNRLVKYKGYKDDDPFLRDNNIQTFAYNRDEVIAFFNRKNLKKWTSVEERQLLEAAIADDKKEVLKMLKAHGWKPGDEDHSVWIYLVEWEDHDFLSYVAKRFTKTNNTPINLEIRIACNVPIGIRGCTIHFFDGMAKTIASRSPKDNDMYIDVMNLLVNMDNVEIYEPGDDYSLIEN